MYDSRTDSDVLRSKRSWDSDEFNPFLRRCYADKGQGDRVEWGTPKARILATKRVKRAVLAAEMAEFRNNTNPA